MFDEQFIKNLPPEKWEALFALTQYFFLKHKALANTPWRETHDQYIEAYALFESFAKANSIAFQFKAPSRISEQNKNLAFEIAQSLDSMARKRIETRNTLGLLEEARARYGSVLGKGFAYVFSDGDLKRIQELINELRTLISDSEQFEEDHKSRLLKRLEKLQQELHKRMSSLDKFWGLVGEAGVVLGKFGNDSKPFVDRIREIAQIIWSTQIRSEELPSGLSLPLLTEQKDQKHKEGETN